MPAGFSLFRNKSLYMGNRHSRNNETIIDYQVIKNWHRG